MAVGAAALIGNAVEGEEAEEKGEKKCSKLYTLLQSGNGILAMKGQLRMRHRTGRRTATAPEEAEHEYRDDSAQITFTT